MWKFPGEDGATLLYKNNEPVYYEPVLKIGAIATCLVHKSLPAHTHVFITHVDGKKCSIQYKAVLRLQDYKANVNENTFLDDYYKRGDLFDGLIISFGDNYGCYISTISENLGEIKNR